MSAGNRAIKARKDRKALQDEIARYQTLFIAAVANNAAMRAAAEDVAKAASQFHFRRAVVSGGVTGRTKTGGARPIEYRETYKAANEKAYLHGTSLTQDVHAFASVFSHSVDAE